MDWKTTQTAVPTDHSLVQAKYTLTSAPTIGKGRVTLPIHALDDKDWLDTVEERGKSLEVDLWNLQDMHTPREIENPQTLWKKFKDTILAKWHAEMAHHKIMTRIRKIQEDLCILANHPDLDNDDRARVNESFLERELAHLQKIVA
jgi:hypothetical protein